MSNFSSTAFAVLAALCAFTPAGRVAAAEPWEQAGDIFVGAVTVNSAGGVYRVRGGVAVPVCTSTINGFDAGYWGVPSSLVVDRKGRVVFIAKLGAYWPAASYGLLRCAGPDGAVEKLAIFPSASLAAVDPSGWPEPFPGKLIESGFARTSIGSLHVLHVGTITESGGGLPHVAHEDAYEFIVRDFDGTLEPIRVGADSGRWQDGSELAAVPAGISFPSVVEHGGDSWMLQSTDTEHANQSTLTRLATPIELSASGSIAGVDFHVSLGLFGGQQLLVAPKVKISDVEYLGTSCILPQAVDGDVIPARLSNTNQVLFDEYGGKGVVITDTYAPLPSFISGVRSALLDDDPTNDLHGYAVEGPAAPYCNLEPKIEVDRFLNFRDADGTLNYATPVAFTDGGLVGSQIATGEVVRLAAGDKARKIVGGLVQPGGLAGYPAKIPSAGTVVTVSIHSPLSVLLTDAGGRALGTDPATGLPVNDFVLHGFDSGDLGAGAPHILALLNPAPGAFTLDAVDTGDGPYTIEVACANLDTGATDLITTSGTASTGLTQAVDFDLADDGTLAFTGALADTTPPVVTCDAPDGLWHAADVSLACTASDDESGLADPADAAFTLSTSVAAGVETDVAATDSRTVCDVAGNCTLAGPIGGNRVDRKAPEVTIASPTAAAYVVGADVAAAYACSDGGSGVAMCNGTVAEGDAVDTGSVGAKTFAVASEDAVGNASTATVAYSVGYAVHLVGAAPLVRKAGAVIPVRLELQDASGTSVSSGLVEVRAVSVDGGPAEAAGGANVDGLFRHAGGGYIYNLSTKGLAPGAHVLTVEAAGDPVAHPIPFTLW